MTLSTFPTFLTFLTEALCFPVPASDSWQGLEIPSYPRRERLGPQRRRLDRPARVCLRVHHGTPPRRLPDRRGHTSGS
jgi:hypothetical protein